VPKGRNTKQVCCIRGQQSCTCDTIGKRTYTINVRGVLIRYVLDHIMYIVSPFKNYVDVDEIPLGTRSKLLFGGSECFAQIMNELENQNEKI